MEILSANFVDSAYACFYKSTSFCLSLKSIVALPQYNQINNHRDTEVKIIHINR